MVTKHPRLNVTLSADEWSSVQAIAAKQNKSLSTVARELIERALELDEDVYYSNLAEVREAETTKWHTHEEVWGKDAK